MKQVSVYNRWQQFVGSYEDLKRSIETDESLNPEEKLEKVVALQEKVISGLDVLEENLEGGN